MRKLVFVALLALLLCSPCSAKPLRTQQPEGVLFVGNSLTYVGNLPAVFSALARANGHDIRSYMIVQPGGTLSERVADGNVPRALEQCGCRVLVLQERGGDLFGGFGDEARAQSKRAVTALARSGRERGASVVLLGTYNSPNVSHHLVLMEGAAANAAGIPYVAVSDLLWRLRKADPSLGWLRKEGWHPGKALALLDAMLLYKQLYGSYPAANRFVVHAPIYDTHSGLTPELRKADAPPPNPATPRSVSYSAGMVGKLLRLLEEPGD